MKPHPLSRAQARALIDGLRNGRDLLRDRALLVVLYRAGLRVDECCRQELADWTLAKGGASVIRVSHPKGEATWGECLRVGMDPTATAIVTAWVERRGAGDGPLFWTRSKRPVHPTHVRRLLRATAARVGIERRVHPHCLRHTFARELYDEGKGIREIQLALGHSSLATTEKYLRSIGATEAVAATTNREKW